MRVVLVGLAVVLVFERTGMRDVVERVLYEGEGELACFFLRGDVNPTSSVFATRDLVGLAEVLDADIEFDFLSRSLRPIEPDDEAVERGLEEIGLRIDVDELEIGDDALEARDESEEDDDELVPFLTDLFIALRRFLSNAFCNRSEATDD